LRADDHIELRRQYGSSGEEIVNPLAIPLWPLVSKDETDKWNKRFSRVLEMATNFDNGIHPEGFDSFRLDHWRPGEDW
jgi:hypothetical protein